MADDDDGGLLMIDDLEEDEEDDEALLCWMEAYDNPRVGRGGSARVRSLLLLLQLMSLTTWLS